jgi:acetolactate synthase I/II/III large subunit
MKKTVSEITSDFISSKGIEKVFLLTGGGIMYLTDAFAKNEKIDYVCNFHEQACAIAAEGYARVTGKPGVCIVTTGPGASNAISGALSAWHDSIPLIIICGQVRTNIIANNYDHIRQIGPQEANIIELAKSMTKYAISVRNKEDIYEILDEAYEKATTGRPGPVLIEIPLDIQSAFLDYDQTNIQQIDNETHNEISDEQIELFFNEIKMAKFPVLFPGNGIRISNSYNLWIEFLNKLNIPAVLPYCAKDLIPFDNPLNMGVVGTNGQRPANFTVQGSDLLISIASGISISKIGFNAAGFAPNAKKIVLDIDQSQLNSHPLNFDIKIQCDVNQFLTKAIQWLEKNNVQINEKWLEACAYWKQKYPMKNDNWFKDTEHVNMYYFTESLSKLVQENSIIVTGNGYECASVYQSFQVKKQQRVLISGNWGAMGWDLPTAVGASTVSVNSTVYLLTGDGSVMLNIQELLTIKSRKLPVKIFIFNNKGYAAIRFTQNNLLGGFIVGADFETGLSNPDFEYLAKAFDLKYYNLNNNLDIDEKLAEIIKFPGSCLCELNISKDVRIEPKAQAFKKPDGTIESKPLHDMYPYLSEDELNYNLNFYKNN